MWVKGHLWGKEIEELLSTIDNNKFDVIILSDLIFNHTCHSDLLTTCKNAIDENGKVYVSFTHHRPKYIDKDMNFFELARNEFGFNVEKQFSQKLKPMFEVDEGPEDIRATVHFYILTKNKGQN